MSGRSSGVEHNLAKVGVGRSNRLARSIFFMDIDIGAAFTPRVLQFVGNLVSIVELRGFTLASLP